MPDLSVGAEIEKINLEIRACQKCDLCKTRKNAVPGEGSISPQILFIGEGPGRNENLEGRPFVGRAGSILDELLHSIGLKRESVYITNIVKCRPTVTSIRDSDSRILSVKDRKPVEGEVLACAPYLTRQIQLLNPRVICALGDTASSTVLKKYGLTAGMISKTHGRVFSTDSLKIVSMYHPAAALYTAALRDIMVSDFEVLSDLLRQKTLI